MSQVLPLDQSRDLTGETLATIREKLSLPDFVKTASEAQRCGDPVILPQHAYAYPVSRSYPCHTPAATWLSAAFFQEKRAQWSPMLAASIESRLKEAAAYWNIAAVVTDVLTDKLVEKQANADYAVVEYAADGTTRQQYPLRNPTEIKQAAAWLTQYRDDLQREDRQHVAANILRAAEKQAAALDAADDLCRMAGYGYCDPTTIADAWRSRATRVQRSRPDLADAAMKLAAAVTSPGVDVMDNDVRQKLAASMEQFDQVAGLTKLYRTGLERPDDVIFRITEKTAGDLRDTLFATTSGAVYEKSALHSVTAANLTDWLGEDITEAASDFTGQLDLEKLASVLGTLPRPDAEIFDRMAQSLRISPVSGSGSRSARLTGAELNQLAAML